MHIYFAFKKSENASKSVPILLALVEKWSAKFDI